MNDQDRIRRLERMMIRMMRRLGIAPKCRSCGLDSRSIDEVDLIEDTDRCGECHANDPDIEEIHEKRQR